MALPIYLESSLCYFPLILLYIKYLTFTRVSDGMFSEIPKKIVPPASTKAKCPLIQQTPRRT